MTITLDQPTIVSRQLHGGWIEINGERIPVRTKHEVQTYAPSEPGRDRNGGDYAGGVLFAIGHDGTVYARDWDSSDWDDRHEWGRASEAERQMLAALLG